METLNKIQINGSIKTDGNNRVLEKTLLLNIRVNDVLEATQLYNQLRLKLNNEESFIEPPFEESPEDEETSLFPIEEEEESQEQCPACSGKLVERRGKNGVFTGCSRYPSCRYTRPF